MGRLADAEDHAGGGNLRRVSQAAAVAMITIVVLLYIAVLNPLGLYDIIKSNLEYLNFTLFATLSILTIYTIAFSRRR